MKKLLSIGLIALICATAFAGGGGDKTDPLDTAIRETSDYLNANLTAGIKLAFINIQSDYPAFSEYIIDELITNTVNDRTFTVVDRQQLDTIRNELNFQMSGEVDDRTAQELGRMAGAQTIVTGNIQKIGSSYRLRVRALNVQSAQIEGQHNANIPDTQLVKDLTQASGGARTAQATSARAGTQPATAQQTQPATPAASTVPTYKAGDTGPAGGIIFYDKGNNNGGWRYLEAAPVEAEFRARWSVHNTEVETTQPAMGSGKRNTQLIVEALNKVSGEWDTAAQKCDELVFGGFDDWFLPSTAELDQMYGQLKRRNLGNFKDDYYWSSTQSNITTHSGRFHQAEMQNFRDGRQERFQKNNGNYYVRPIRQVAGQ